MPAAAESSSAWERRFVPFDLRAETDGRTIKGYAIVFNTLSENLGGFKERIRPEFVDRTLREGLDVRALIDHDSGKVIGRISAGTLKLQKDRRGLRSVISPPNTSYANDLIESVDRGDISGMSFAFRTTPDGEDWSEEDGLLIRDVLDGWIREVSVVSFPAYPDTSVALRSLDAFKAYQEAHQLWKPSMKFRDRLARAVKR